MTLHFRGDSEKVWVIIFYLKSSTCNALSLTKHLHFQTVCLDWPPHQRKDIFSVSRTEKKKKFYRLILHLVLKLWTYLFLSFTVYFFRVSAQWLCCLVERKTALRIGSSRGNMVHANQWCSWINRKTYLPVQFVKLKISFMSRKWIEFLLFYKEK